MSDHEPRIDYRHIGASAFKAYYEFHNVTEVGGLERSPIELVKLVVGINGWNRLAMALRPAVGGPEAVAAKAG